MFFNGRRKRPGEVPYGGTNIAKSNGLRLARVINVYLLPSDAELYGTVDISFLDGQGTRKNVIATQTSPSALVLPNVNDVVTVGFSSDGTQCFIMGYLPIPLTNVVNHVKNAPPTIVADPGDVSLQRQNTGQGIYLTGDGNILINNGRSGQTKYNQVTNTIEHRDINFSLITEAGTFFWGVTKRILGGFSGIMGFGNNFIKDSSEKALTELVLKVSEYSDNDIFGTPEQPVLEIGAGNIVNNVGVTDGKIKLQVNVLKQNELNINETKCSVKLTNDGNIFIQGNQIVFNDVSSSVLTENIPENAFVTFDEFVKVIDDIEQLIKTHVHTDVTTGTGATTQLGLKCIDKNNSLVEACRSKRVRVS